MTEKLILSLEESVVRQAKKYAEQTGNTLSSLVENYLKSVSKPDLPSKVNQLSPIVKQLKGAFKTTEIADYEQELQAELSKKYQ